MSLAKVAFNVLYCLAGCDGTLEEREREIIIDFLDRHETYLGRMDFEPQQAVSEITARSSVERGESFISDLKSLKVFTGALVRTAMLDAATEIAAADGAVSDGERSLFQTMAAIWGIDLPDYVRRRTAEAQANAAFEKNARENFYAWSLGKQMALDALALLRFDDGRVEPHFDKAKKAAAELGLTVNRLTGITADRFSNNVKAWLYLMVDEGERINKVIDSVYGAAVAAHFKLIVNCYRLLLAYGDNPKNGSLVQTFLDAMISGKSQTALPEDYFQPLVAAVRENADYYSFLKIVEDFDAAASNFLYKRFKISTSVPAATPNKKTNRANVFAWTLGGALANYSMNAAFSPPDAAAADFDKACMSAEVLGLTIKPMPTGFDPVTGDIDSMFYLQKNWQIADEIEIRYGKAAASYFKLIVECYLSLLPYNSKPEALTFSQTALDRILSLKLETEIPDWYFQPLVAATCQAADYKTLKQTILDFDREVYEFLCCGLRA